MHCERLRVSRADRNEWRLQARLRHEVVSAQDIAIRDSLLLAQDCDALARKFALKA